MKANELMIGDMVGYSSLTRMVTAINPPYFIDLGNGERTTITNVCIEHLNPIPISEELLAKNGFKHEYDCICEYTYYIREIDGYFVEIKIGCSNMGDEYVNCHIDNCDRNSVANADIRYLHQLQNLLNIMNIKFDIKLLHEKRI